MYVDLLCSLIGQSPAPILALVFVYFVYSVCESFQGDAGKETSKPSKTSCPYHRGISLNCFKVIGSHWHAENADRIGALPLAADTRAAVPGVAGSRLL